jgi:hypothetical protein
VTCIGPVSLINTAALSARTPNSPPRSTRPKRLSAPPCGAAERQRSTSSAYAGSLDVGRARRLAANAPLAAADLLDPHPGHAPHASPSTSTIALDFHHRVGHLFDHLRLLLRVKDAFDHLDIHQWHCLPPLVKFWWDERGIGTSGRPVQQMEQIRYCF